MKTQLQLLCNRTFKTRTQDEINAHRIHKIHLAYQAHEKRTQDEMHLKNYLVVLIKETHFLKDQSCGEMRSIKTSVNLYRILEFTFRNIRQTIAYSTDSRTRKLPKGILGWASGTERIEWAERNLQKALSALKEIWPLRSRSTPLTCSGVERRWSCIDDSQRYCQKHQLLAILRVFGISN